MAKKVKVVINRREFGKQVTGSPEMMAVVESLGRQVAARVPGAEVEVLRQRVRGGGLRATARIKHGSNAEEARTGKLLAALMNVAPAKKTKR